jgi:hypothetical protein
MYHTESCPWTKAEVIKLKETEMRSLKIMKAKTRKNISGENIMKNLKTS